MQTRGTRSLALIVAVNGAFVLVGGVATVATGAADPRHGQHRSVALPATTTATAKPHATKSTKKTATVTPVSHTLSYPPTVNGLAKIPDQTADLNKTFAAPDAAIEGKHFTGAAYGNPNGVTVVAALKGHLSASDRADAVAGLVDDSGSDSGDKTGPFVAHAPGPLGGDFKCATYTSKDLPGRSLLCYWADDDTTGIVFVFRHDEKPGATTANPSLAIQARQQVEKASA